MRAERDTHGRHFGGELRGFFLVISLLPSVAIE